jgi:hypothetical protein
VVDLVEDDEGTGGFGLGAVQHRLAGDLRVGHGDTDEGTTVAAVRVLEVGVDRKAHPCSGVGPLALEVVRRGDDGDPVDDAAVHELRGHPQGEGRLTGAGGRHGEEVAR